MFTNPGSFYTRYFSCTELDISMIFSLKGYHMTTIHMDSGKFHGQRETVCEFKFTVVMKEIKKDTGLKKMAKLQQEFRARKHD